MQLDKLKINLDELLKPSLAYDWDNVGLNIGDKTAYVNKVLITLEINEAVVDEAISKDVQLIISHHPLIFRPIKSITNFDDKGNILLKLIKNSIGVYVAHTNFDIIEGGLNDYISNLLSLNNINKLAYENSDIDAIGRYGELKEEMSVEEFIMFVKTKLNLSDLRIVDGGNSKIRKVGIVTGSGIEYASNAFEAGCDAYLTGDIKYHDAQDWLGRGMNIFDVGHYGSEIHFKENMLRILRDKLGEEVDFVVSDALKDPFRAV